MNKNSDAKLKIQTIKFSKTFSAIIRLFGDKLDWKVPHNLGAYNLQMACESPRQFSNDKETPCRSYLGIDFDGESHANLKGL